MNTIQFKCETCKTEQASANTRATGQYWCETCQSWRPILVVAVPEIFEPVTGPDPRD